MIMRTYKVLITKKNHATLPSGSVLGFGYLLRTETLEDALDHASRRLTLSHDAANLFLESVTDVTP